MSRYSLRLAFCLVPAMLLSLALLPSLGQAGASPGMTGYSTEISVEPSEKASGAFLCKAVIKNLASGAVVAAPAVLTTAGDQAETASTLEDTALEIRFIVQVDAAASVASYSIVASNAGVDTLLHRGSVQLAKTPS